MTAELTMAFYSVTIRTQIARQRLGSGLEKK